jgi:tetratricopeptide (TPR) repeat protein
MNQEIEGLKEANSLIKAGKKDEAFPILKSILKINRDNAPAWFLLVNCLDKPEDKAFCYKEIIRINPNDIKTKKELELIETKQPDQPKINQVVSSEIPENEVVSSKEIEKSAIPSIFNVIGLIVLICGFLAGWGFGQSTSFLRGFQWPLASIIWVSAFISSMTFFGFGKIIELLVKIVNKL